MDTSKCLLILEFEISDMHWLYPCSDQLMDPEVPQALRLQAVLASGIVKIHERKTNYLKEDAEHAMVSLSTSDIQ